MPADGVQLGLVVRLQGGDLPLGRCHIVGDLCRITAAAHSLEGCCRIFEGGFRTGAGLPLRFHFFSGDIAAIIADHQIDVPAVLAFALKGSFHLPGEFLTQQLLDFFQHGFAPFFPAVFSVTSTRFALACFAGTGSPGI